MLHARKRRTQSVRTLGLEVLEDRTLLSAGATPLDPGGLTANTGPYAQSDILVQFKSGADQGSPVALPGTTLGRQLSLVPGLYEVDLSKGVSVAQALAEYRADAEVLSAEPDYSLGTSAVPNDPRFGGQWDLNNTGQDIHALAAWNVTHGNPHITVAVMDSGVDYNHPDLYRNIWLNQAEIPKSRRANLVDVDGDGLITFKDLNDPRNQGPGKITDVNQDGRIDAGDVLAPMVRDGQGRDTGQGGWAYPGNTQDGDTAHPNDFVGWNFVNNTNNPFDDNGHGTHVTGTIAAAGNNGDGIAGIDWQAQVMPVKFIGAGGGGDISAFIAGLGYAVKHGARISNNSWAGAVPSSDLYRAIANARAHGQIFVAAAGNTGTNNDQMPAFPSNYKLDNVVSVAATDESGRLGSFSNYGAREVDLGAPGVGILSTLPGGKYGTMSGTSMATPHVSAVLALVWGQHPDWNYRQVIARVLNTTDKDPNLAGKAVTGGVVDAAAAVGAGVSVAGSPGVLLPQVSGSSATGPRTGALDRVRLTFNKPIDARTLNAGAVHLSGPGGTTVPVTVRALPGSNGQTFDIVFKVQTAPGQYVLSVGPGVRDLPGHALLSYKATYTISKPPVKAPAHKPAVSKPAAKPPAAKPAVSKPSVSKPAGKPPAGKPPAAKPAVTKPPVRKPAVFTSRERVAIPDRGRVPSSLWVGPDVRIGKVTVRIHLTDRHDGALRIHLQAPDGTHVVLVNHRGGGGHDFWGTVFDDQATTRIRDGKAPFADLYRPEEPLSALAGKHARGTWKLWVEDGSGGGRGTLDGWSLTITPAAGTARVAAAGILP